MPASHVFTIRLSPEENAALTKSATGYGVKRSRIVRRLLRELIRQRPDYFDQEQNDLRGLNQQLSAIGRNLNQIARKLNSNEVISKNELEHDLTQMKGELKAVRSYLGKEIEAATRRTVRVVNLPDNDA